MAPPPVGSSSVAQHWQVTASTVALGVMVRPSAVEATRKPCWPERLSSQANTASPRPLTVEVRKECEPLPPPSSWSTTGSDQVTPPSVERWRRISPLNLPGSGTV